MNGFLSICLMALAIGASQGKSYKRDHTSANFQYNFCCIPESSNTNISYQLFFTTNDLYEFTYIQEHKSKGDFVLKNSFLTFFERF